MFWRAMDKKEYLAKVHTAVKQNLRYSQADVLGFPGSFLDQEIFPVEQFVEEHPFLLCLRENPNHIGCHTLTESERAFSGTQALEVDLIRLCAEEIAGAPALGYDGYVGSGGTECNIEAMWIFRNALGKQGISPQELALVCSEDTHYSAHKAANLLGIDLLQVPVDENSRQMEKSVLAGQITEAKRRGKRAFVCILNMGTTMFGSVDDIDSFCAVLDGLGVEFRIHIDAAFGGFFYPFSTPVHRLDFRNPRVLSMTMDAHKMLQAPYGTGIFLCRKGMLENVCTEAAAYVHGKDYTLCGSRSGASAVAVWMILQAYGSEGGIRFVKGLLERTDRLCAGLTRLGISYFRAAGMNVVTMKAQQIPPAIAERFTLVPDSHEGTPRYVKAVVMDHVTEAAIDRFLGELENS